MIIIIVEAQQTNAKSKRWMQFKIQSMSNNALNKVAGGKLCYTRSSTRPAVGLFLNPRQT